MRIAQARLPRLAGVVVMAFAPYERRPLPGAVDLFRGVAIQLAYRWSNRQVLAEACDRAVLMWSVAHGGGHRQPLRPEVLGVLTAISVGTALLMIGNALLFVPVGVVLRAAGVTPQVVVDVVAAAVGVRLLLIVWRALRAYQNDTALMSLLPSPSVTRWRIDYLAAVPAGQGHGGRLLEEFLGHADDHDVEVVLHCPARNVAFYRHHGFHLVNVGCTGDQRLMLRDARSTGYQRRPVQDVAERSRARYPAPKAALSGSESKGAILTEGTDNVAAAPLQRCQARCRRHADSEQPQSSARSGSGPAMIGWA